MSTFNFFVKIRFVLAVTQWIGISQHIMPLAKMSTKRSDKFPSKEFVSAKLRNKFLFKDFGEKSFQNYIEYGFTELQQAVTLRFKKEVETKIFALTPPFYKKIKHKVPSYYLFASHGNIADTRPISAVKHLFPSTTFIAFDGGHLFPFEHTEQCASEITQILTKHK